MPELLKNRYNQQSIKDLANRICAVYPSFKSDDFVNDIMDTTWQALELKARMRQITINLGRYLPNDYARVLAILDKVVDNYPIGFNDFTLMCFPDFVEVYGQAECHWDLSMAALAKYTVSSSSEFAVRPFIINNEKRMMQQMSSWASNANEHIRRLASEGCRPQLPWGQVLHCFKQDPTAVLDILEKLKTDPSLYVRKSVANNLNDISKTHPELIASIARDWYGHNEHTDWIVKHGCRTLLKKGNRDVLSIFGFVDTDTVQVNGFALDATAVAIGEDIHFLFSIEVQKSTKVRLEYAIDYMKASGKRNRKIFQISELLLKADGNKSYTKKHSFADNSTRRHYQGTHSITLIVNGCERGRLDFELER